MKIEDVRDELVIDRTQLDHELIAQPALVFDVAMKHANAISERDTMKDQLKALEAELAGTVRSELAKPTEGAIKQAVDSSLEMIESRSAYQESCSAARLWEVAFDSVRARGFALHKLVDFELAQRSALYGQSESVERGSRRREADAEVQEVVLKRRTRRVL